MREACGFLLQEVVAEELSRLNRSGLSYLDFSFRARTGVVGGIILNSSNISSLGNEMRIRDDDDRIRRVSNNKKKEKS